MIVVGLYKRESPVGLNSIFLQTSYSSIFYYILEYIARMIILLNFLSYIQIMNSLLMKVQNINLKTIRYSCSHELLPRDCS